MSDPHEAVESLLQRTIGEYRTRLVPLKMDRDGTAERLAYLNHEIAKYEQSIASFEEYLNGDSAG